MLDGDSPHVAALWLMFAYCAAPGAVNAESLRRGLQGGFTSAVLVQLGAVAGRVLWAGLALAGAGVVDSSSPVHALLASTGAFLLLRSSWHALAATVSAAPAAAIVGWGRRAATRGALRLAEVVSGLALGLFGLQLLWETAGFVCTHPVR